MKRENVHQEWKKTLDALGSAIDNQIKGRHSRASVDAYVAMEHAGRAASALRGTLQSRAQKRCESTCCATASGKRGSDWYPRSKPATPGGNRGVKGPGWGPKIDPGDGPEQKRRSQDVIPKKRKVNRSTTERLKRLIEAELERQNLTDEEAAREARLPGNAFRALRKGHRPIIDRADELCRALGISMMIGSEAPTTSRRGGSDR